MKSVQVGDVIGISCKLNPGPFSDEYFIAIETLSQIISGFVRTDNIIKIDDESGYIRAEILDVDSEKITAWVFGSFFSTTGLAYLSPNTDFHDFSEA